MQNILRTNIKFQCIVGIFLLRFVIFTLLKSHAYKSNIYDVLDGNYDELITNTEIDIVYVGNIHAFRRSIGEKVLKANKHCLLEKPFACNAIDAQYLISLAQERNLFFMEVMISIKYIVWSISSKL